MWLKEPRKYNAMVRGKGRTMNEEIKPGRDFKDDILREQVRLAMKQLPTMQITSFIVAIVLSYTVSDIIPHADIATWDLMVLAIVVSRIVLYSRFLKVREQPFAGEPAVRSLWWYCRA